jgi:hypothetical protein
MGWALVYLKQTDGAYRRAQGGSDKSGQQSQKIAKEQRRNENRVVQTSLSVVKCGQVIRM